MNCYSYEDLSVGMTESFSATITEDMMKRFLSITGDVNPLHNDADFAKEKGFADRVVYGMLTASFLSTLAGVYIPGEKCLIQQVDTKFVKPVMIGDTITVKGTVDSMNDTVHQVVLKVEIRNQREEKVLRGTMKVGVI